MWSRACWMNGRNIDWSDRARCGSWRKNRSSGWRRNYQDDPIVDNECRGLQMYCWSWSCPKCEGVGGALKEDMKCTRAAERWVQKRRSKKNSTLGSDYKSPRWACHNCSRRARGGRWRSQGVGSCQSEQVFSCLRAYCRRAWREFHHRTWARASTSRDPHAYPPIELRSASSIGMNGNPTRWPAAPGYRRNPHTLLTSAHRSTSPYTISFQKRTFQRTFAWTCRRAGRWASWRRIPFLFALSFSSALSLTFTPVFVALSLSP